MPLLHDDALGSSPDGGLTKLGAGSLRLGGWGPNTSTGPNTVLGGTLILPASGTSSAAALVAAGATLRYNGTLITPASTA